MSFEAEVEKRSGALEKARPLYQRYKSQLPELMEQVVPNLLSALYRYLEGDDPHKAVFILAQCQQVAGDLWDIIKSVQHFESQELSLRRIQASQTAEQVAGN